MKHLFAIHEDIYLLQVPFGAYWTGVTIIKGAEPMVIDSGPSAEMVDKMILPALSEIGCCPEDLRYLVCTHTHGDHVGGHARLLACAASCKVVASAEQADKLKDPLAYAKRIRTRFPADSPPVQSALRGVRPDLLLENGALLGGRLRLIHAPGHDTDSVCWLDTVSGTLITGDSVQGEGAAGSGLAFYQSLSRYRDSLNALQNIEAQQWVSGHDYAPHGCLFKGPRAVREYLTDCLSVTERYDYRIRRLWNEGQRNTAELARRLVALEGRTPPPHLFLEMYTVTAHLQEAGLC